MLSNVRLEDLIRWTGAQTKGRIPQVSIQEISTDSRGLSAGSLFVALKGERFDGHDYLDAVAKQGAVAAIVDKKDVKSTLPLLKVPDSLHAMAAIARELRRRFRGPVIALTGSAGKSSTKNMLASLLGTGTLSSPKSFNNLLGVSKTLYLLEDSTQRAVLEVGMNAEGEIAEICEYAEPQLALITNIGTAHIGRLGGQEGIFRAKKELFAYIGRNANGSRGAAVNVDDSLILRAAEEALPKNIRRITYSSQGAQADVQILSKTLNPKNGALQVEMRFAGKSGKYEVPIFGLHQAENLAAAVAGALLMGETADAIVQRLPSIRSAEHRGEVFETKKGIFVLDESYNSNPSALIASLRSTFELNPNQRRVLVLGEMRELDAFSDQLHESAADALIALHQKKKIPFVLIGVGKGFAPFLKKVQSSLPQIPAQAAENAEVAIQQLGKVLQTGDIVLVKGSRGIQLDHVVKWLQG